MSSNSKYVLDLKNVGNLIKNLFNKFKFYNILNYLNINKNNLKDMVSV